MIHKTGTPGRTAENLALDYLLQQGLKLIERNYYCRFGEIDLIMQDCTEIAFIEVRFRAYDRYGSAIESVSKIKQNKLITTASHYLMTKKLGDTACRFDVVGLSGMLKEPNINWIRNAINT